MVALPFAARLAAAKALASLMAVMAVMALELQVMPVLARR
jgi:hypothetical protein